VGQKFSIIAQSSLTYAYKGEAILRENGIHVQILRLSGQKTQRGCGYGLSVKDNELQRALSLLRQRGAFIGEIIK
jgi:hypothetical protein